MTFMRTSLSIAILSLTLGTANTALAGFEWVPEKTQPRKVYRPQTRQITQPRTNREANAPIRLDNSYAAPDDMRDNSVMSKVLEQFQPTPDNKTNTPFINTMDQDTSARDMTNSAPMAMQSDTPSENMMPSNTQMTYESIDGFGSDIPLAMALRQVVPPSYSFAFGDAVNAGAKVSWSGGKPWNQVMQDMVSPLDVSANITGKTISLTKTQGAWTSSATSYPAVITHNSGSPDIGDAYSPPPARINPSAIPPMTPTATAEATNDPLLPMPVQDDIAFAQPSPRDTTSANSLASDTAMTATVSTSMDAMEYDFNNRPSRRTRMIDRIQQQTDAQNIEMRMNASSPFTNFTDKPPAPSAMQTGRPYSIEPYVPPSYTMPERNAAVSNDAYTGNKVSNIEAKTWEASRGDSLKQTFLNWSRQEGINMVWNSDRDYTLTANVFINDTFKNAVRTVYDNALQNAEKPPLKFLDDPMSAKPTTFVVGG